MKNKALIAFLIVLNLAVLLVAGPSIYQVYQGGTGLNAVAAHQVFVGTASNVFTAKTIPDCQDSGGNHLNYTQSGDSFNCGTTSSGGGGGSISTPLTEVAITTTRANNTAYQNTSGGPLLVIAVGTGASNLVQCITDSSSSPTQVVDERDMWHGTGGDSSCVMVVASSNYYKCNCGTIIQWREWTFSKGTMSIAGDLSSNGSGTRAAGTVYHNTGSSPILVVSTFQNCNATSGAHPFQGLADTNTTPTTLVWQDDPPSSSSYDHVMFWVLPGEYYEVNANSNGGTLYRWYEYTWSGVTATKVQANTSSKLWRCSSTYNGPGYGSTNCYVLNASMNTIRWPQVQGTGGSGGDRTLACGGDAPIYESYDAVTSGSIESVGCPVQPMGLYAWTYNTGTGGVTAWWEWNIG